MITSYFGKHNNMWLFIERLQDLENDSFLDENQLEYQGILSLKPGKLVFKLNNERIDLLKIEFDIGRKAAVLYICAVSHCI